MTNKDYLSQEEIDALLRQTTGDDLFGKLESEASQNNTDDLLTPLEQDALGEIGNIMFGSAATALSTLLGKKVEITTPQVSAIPKQNISSTFPEPHVAVHVNFVDGFYGINLLVIKTGDAQVIADLMLGGTGHPQESELNEIHISAVQEAMNQMMGSAATSMSTIFNRFVNISPPGVDVLDFGKEKANELLSEDVYIQVSFRLTIGDLIDSNIMLLLPVWFAKEMVSSLMGGGEASSSQAPEAASSSGQAAAPQQQQPEPEQTPPVPQGGNYGAPPHGYPQQPHAPAPGYAAPPPGYGYPPPYPPAYGMGPQGASPNFGGQPGPGVPQRNVQSAQFADFADYGAAAGEQTNLNLLLDIPLKVTVELGRTQRQIKDILELSQGSVIELDKLAGEPVDILVNNKLIAKGEVVVIDENFGVRVTDIISPWDRIQKLQ